MIEGIKKLKIDHNCKFEDRQKVLKGQIKLFTKRNNAKPK